MARSIPARYTVRKMLRVLRIALVLPLARLVDGDGTSYGDGMVYIQRRSSAPENGKTLYVWMRMPEILGRDRAFFEVFRFAAEKMTRR